MRMRKLSLCVTSASGYTHLRCSKHPLSAVSAPVRLAVFLCLKFEVQTVYMVGSAANTTLLQKRNMPAV